MKCSTITIYRKIFQDQWNSNILTSNKQYFWLNFFNPFRHLPSELAHLISLTYVIDGVSFKPIHSPSTMNPKQMIGNDCENPSIIQEIKSGTLTNMNDFRRPILSQTGPLSKLPIGCATCAKLAMKLQTNQ